MNPTKNLLLILAAGLVLACLAGESRADKQPAHRPCGLAIEEEASAVIFELRLVLEQKNALSSDEFPTIRRALDTLENHARSNKARRCFRQMPSQGRHYSAWLQHQAGALIARATLRLESSCSRRTRMFIHSNKLRIDAAVRGKHLARAARYARSLQKQLQENPMIRRCSSTREEVSRLEKDYLSAVLNQAALPEVQAKMAQAYWNAAQTLAAARTALATHDRNISPAPSTLESAAGRDQLQEELSRCIDYAHALTELGAPASTPLSLPDGQGIESEIAAAICVRESAKLDSTVQAVVTHNQRYQDHVLERWRRVSIKGWGMEKVFNERGRPQSESTLSGGAIVWTYRNRESCQQVRFSPRGKLIAEASGRCAVQLGSAQPAR